MKRLMTLAVLTLAAGGCSMLDQLGLQKPTAKITDVSLADLDTQSVTLDFDIDVSNPYSIPLPLTNLDYELASGGTTFLSGQGDAQGTVPALGSRTIPLSARVPFTDLLSVVKTVRPGQVLPYDATLGLSVEPPTGGELRLPLTKSGEMPIPAAPSVDIPQIQWDKIDLTEAAGTLRMNLTNNNSFPLDLEAMEYALSLGGTQIATSKLTKAIHFDADGGANTLEIPISISAKQVGVALLGVLRGGAADYGLIGQTVADTKFGPITLPLEAAGQTLLKR